MVYVFLATGFEEVEALAPIDILRRGKVEVKTIGVGGPIIRSSHGVPITVDAQLAEVQGDDPEMIVLPGGTLGVQNLEASAGVQAFIDQAAQKDRWICAICAAPSILGHKGLLKGRRATAYPTLRSELTGATVLEDKVVQDGQYITSRGAGASLEFGAAVLAALRGQDVAEAILAQIQY